MNEKEKITIEDKARIKQKLNKDKDEEGREKRNVYMILKREGRLR